MNPHFLYGSKFKNELIDKCFFTVTRLRDLGLPLEVINTFNWDEETEEKFYYSIPMLINVKNLKKLRGIMRTHRTGLIHHTYLLLNSDGFLTSEKVIEKPKELVEV